MIFYVRLPCFSQHMNSLIQKSKRREKWTKSYVSFPLGKHQFTVKEVTRAIDNNYVSIIAIFKIYWFPINKKKCSRYFMLAFSLFWVFTTVDNFS